MPAPPTPPLLLPGSLRERAIAIRYRLRAGLDVLRMVLIMATSFLSQRAHGIVSRSALQRSRGTSSTIMVGIFTRSQNSTIHGRPARENTGVAAGGAGRTAAAACPSASSMACNGREWDVTSGARGASD